MSVTSASCRSSSISICAFELGEPFSLVRLAVDAIACLGLGAFLLFDLGSRAL